MYLVYLKRPSGGRWLHIVLERVHPRCSNRPSRSFESTGKGNVRAGCRTCSRKREKKFNLTVTSVHPFGPTIERNSVKARGTRTPRDCTSKAVVMSRTR